MKKKKWYDKPPIPAMLLFLLLLIFPFTIRGCLLDGTQNAEWVGFWGAYGGSALAALTTLIAFSFTYTENQEQNCEIKEQNVEMQKQLIEQMRLQVLPFINMTHVQCAKETYQPVIKINGDGSGCTDREKNISESELIYLLENIGSGPATSVVIAGYSLGHIPVKTPRELILSVPGTLTHIEHIVVSYQDCQSRCYTQEITLELDQNKVSISPPVLVSPS